MRTLAGGPQGGAQLQARAAGPRAVVVRHEFGVIDAAVAVGVRAAEVLPDQLVRLRGGNALLRVGGTCRLLSH